MLRDTLESVIRTLLDYADLCVVIIGCGILFVLDALNIIDDHWVNSAILSTLTILAFASIRDRKKENKILKSINSLFSNLKRESAILTSINSQFANLVPADNVRWYFPRDKATDLMKEDMKHSKHLVFLGISHSQLYNYFREVLDNSNDFPILPWKTIEIFFSPKYIGDKYEKFNFNDNFIKSRWKLAILMTDPVYRDKLQHLQSISFFQRAETDLVTYTGSLFGSDKDHLSVIYIIHSAGVETHTGLAIRLTPFKGSVLDEKFDYYHKSYKIIPRPLNLGRYAPSTWDKSVLAWKNYVEKSDVLSQSYNFIADYVKETDTVLDVGSGIGKFAEVLLERKKGKKIVLLDGSPQMVDFMWRKYIKESTKESKVQVALCHLPPKDGEDVDFRETKFSLIIIHQSLDHLIGSFNGIRPFADWCYNHLQSDGRVLVTAHNTIVGTNDPEDNFRKDLKNQLQNLGTLRDEKHPSLHPDAIKNGFSNANFTLIKEDSKDIKVTISERERMWKVPAILDTMINIDTIPKEKDKEIDEIIHNVAAPLYDTETAPRTVYLWEFKMAKK